MRDEHGRGFAVRQTPRNNMCIVVSPLAAETANGNLSQQTLRTRNGGETCSNTCDVDNKRFAASDSINFT